MPEQNPFDQFDDAGSISTVTDKPIPTGEEKIEQSSQVAKDIAAGAVRYGAPVAGALATGGLTTIPSLLANAGIAGVSEFSARQIERIGSDPKIDEIWNDLKASAAAGAIDLGVGGALAGIGRGVSAVARRILLPREIPADVELAQTVLGRLSKEGKQATQKWKMFKGKDPFSLTPGQLNRDERGFVTFLEGVARGGTGGGMMTKFDNRNVKHVEEALTKYFDSVTSQKSGPEMGVFFKRLFGFDVDSPVDIFKPVEAYKSYLYKQFDDALMNAKATVDLSNVQKMLQSPAARGKMLDIYRSINLPDASGKGLLPPIMKGDWSNIPAEDVDKILHSFSPFFKAEDATTRRAANNLKDAIDLKFAKTVDNIPEAKQLRDTANSFYGAKQEALFNTTMKAARNSLAKQPSAVVTMFNPLKGNAAAKYDNLMALKKGIYFSAATPDLGTTAGMGAAKAKQLYEDSLLQPIRFRMVDAATNDKGLLDGAKLLKQIEKISAEAPEMLNELWGSPQAVKNIRDLASTLNTIQTSTPDKSIFIQLKTAAAIGTVGGGMWSYFNGDNPAVGGAAGAAIGAATILLAPRMLARTLSNPTITRALTDGINDSVKFRGVSPKLAITFRKMAEMYPVSKMFRDDPSTDSQQFYNFAPIEQEPTQ